MAFSMANTQQLVIVRRNQFSTFAMLAQAFANEPNVRLVWDRRTRDRRRSADAPAGSDRRSGDRRGDQATTWGTNEYLLLTLNERKPGDPSAPEPDIEASVTKEYQQLVRDLGNDLEAAAGSDLSVLLSGGDAVSRKSLAQRIHGRSHRRTRPLIVVDGAAFAEMLAAPGQEDNAHTNALNGGTLFIEEIGQWTWRQQSDLARFLERITASHTANGGPAARLISGTDYWLLDRVAAHEFRADLFYRLNTIHVVLPSNRRARPVASVLVAAPSA
jgi:transcriptional regulator of acetoin/glycerol metabolism